MRAHSRRCALPALLAVGAAAVTPPLPVPRRLRGQAWTVRFSYVPVPGFGASPAADRRRPPAADRRRPPARILNTGQDAP